MDLMIFAAGFGKRMLPITRYIPKPCLPFFSRSILGHVVKIAESLGFKHCVVNSFHLHEQLKKEISGLDTELTIDVVYEKPNILGTAGGLRNALFYFKDTDTIVTMNSDTLFLPPIGKAYDLFTERDADCILLVADHSGLDKKKKIGIDDNGKIHYFAGIWGKMQENLTYLAYSGVSIIKKESILEYIRPNSYACLARDFFKRLLVDKKKIFALPCDSKIVEIGNPKAYLKGHMNFISSISVIDTEINRSLSDIVFSGPGNFEIINNKDRKPSIIYEGSLRDNNAILSGCVVLPGARVKEGIYNNCIIFRDGFVKV